MTSPASFKLYITRLESMREGLTEPNKIKFIDDIFEALKYKDDEINHINNELARIVESNIQLRTERDRYKAEKKLILSVTEKIFLST
jgi:hypothetical protein